MRVVLERSPGGPGGVSPETIARIASEFPAIEVTTRAADGEATVRLEADVWEARAFDLSAFDAQMTSLAERGALALRVVGDGARLERVAGEILTRCQRLSPRRNGASRGAAFDRLLAAHRALHDLGKPLVRADRDHALDTWQWALRLDPGAGLAVQAAALLHDVERLSAEADARVEHLAADYQAFKDAHAAEGGRIARRTLTGAGLPEAEIERAAALVARHERPGGGADLDLLNDADGLSFFSLNSGGFMDYFGIDHTRRKVRYTLARLSPGARLRLAGVRLRADVLALVADEGGRPGGGVT